MFIYLVSDPINITLEELGKIGLHSRFNDWVLIDYSIYSVPSLVAKTVREECDLFIASHNMNIPNESNNPCYGLLKRWELLEIADLAFSNLSGGNYKYVILALQAESTMQNEKVIAANIQQELDHHRVQCFVSNLENKMVDAIFFVDDNPLLLKRKLYPRNVIELSLSDLLNRINDVSA